VLDVLDVEVEVEVEVDVKLAFELAFKTAFEFAFELPPVGEELPGEELPGEELPGEELPGEELLDIVIPNAGNLCYSYIITFRFSYNGPFASCACSAYLRLLRLRNILNLSCLL
jgi:hypothetical protein